MALKCTTQTCPSPRLFNSAYCLDCLKDRKATNNYFVDKNFSIEDEEKRCELLGENGWNTAALGCGQKVDKSRSEKLSKNIPSLSYKPVEKATIIK